VRRVERAGHLIAHPVDGAANELRYGVKRVMHRAVDKMCCSIM
jgi:hypothetical protein